MLSMDTERQANRLRPFVNLPEWDRLSMGTPQVREIAYQRVAILTREEYDALIAVRDSYRALTAEVHQLRDEVRTLREVRRHLA